MAEEWMMAWKQLANRVSLGRIECGDGAVLLAGSLLTCSSLCGLHQKSGIPPIVFLSFLTEILSNLKT